MFVSEGLGEGVRVEDCGCEILEERERGGGVRRGSGEGNIEVMGCEEGGLGC